MAGYEEAYKGLNAAQKQAVDVIDGPVLVIAGPGTGKTQLLSVRVAHILQQTDTLPQNILCLTFTESGAENMRERLTRFIGQDAYSVTISTYHAFGGELIRRFPEVFSDSRLQSPADDLTRRQILRGIVEGLPYDNPLKQLQHHLGDLVSTISEIKRALLDADSLRSIADENAAFIIAANTAVQTTFDGTPQMPRTIAKALPLFEQLLGGLEPLAPKQPTHPEFGSLAGLAITSLKQAIEAAETSGKTTSLTAWKNQWLAKNTDNAFVFDGALATRRIEALANVFEAYQEALAQNGWYDFDDMILRSIQALEDNPDLRFSLQEQYLYILLDEFQDTNAAQLRLVQLLTNNPVNEDRPNVLAVGDDDQAIYAFQGAQYSNMLDFYGMYRDVQVINLVGNYRSTADILVSAQAVAGQIEARLETQFEVHKELKAVGAVSGKQNQTALERREFLSDIAQYDWIAHKIEELIEQGVTASEIAVIAPKHKQLEPLVPYLAELKVPMRYEKRENILEAPVIRQLISMGKLILALQANETAAANALWPEILSFPFWQIPVSELWQMAWKINDAARTSTVAWSQALLASDNEQLRAPALLILSLAAKADSETLEQMLDQLIGTEEVATHEANTPYVRSPLRNFYTSETVQQTNPDLFYDTISHLTVLRARLREHQATRTEALLLRDLISFIEMYEAAEERMLNTSPYNQQAEAVQLMTVFKAKGLEFSHVFLPSMQDDVWGTTSRSNNNKLTLPVNLAPIRHAGATDDERLRILFVAITRAKVGLHMTSFAKTYSGKDTRHLKYLNEQQQADGSFKCLVLPEHAQAVIVDTHEAPSLASLELNWRQRHTDARAKTQLQALLMERLKRYQISPTHLTSFLDLAYAGPEQFFFDVLLRFPRAPSDSSRYGNAIHETLEWVQQCVNQQGDLPPTATVLQQFKTRLSRQHLTASQYELERQRGERALTAYLRERGHQFRPGDVAEHNFRNEAVFIGDVRLSGKVDKLEIDKANRTITVIDYKTSKPHSRWARDTRLHLYQLQLYCYKLLIEHSTSYTGYTVTSGRLEFVEPDSDGNIHVLELNFQAEETKRVGHVLEAMWTHVFALDFPDVSNYSADMKGIETFENDLLSI